jgi:inorganic pyrophosphatase
VSGLPQFCYAEDEWSEPRLITLVASRKHDHKILAVALNDPEFKTFREAAELPPHRLMMLCCFFQDYKMLEAKPVEVDEIEPATRALLIIGDSLQRSSENRRREFP